MSDEQQQPPSLTGAGRPRSPRPPSSPRAAGGQGSAIPPGAFVGMPPPAPRPNIGSLLFLTAFFFFMSNNNNVQPPMIIVGPDGQFVPRVTELDRAQSQMREFEGWFNGSNTGNWTLPPTPQLSPLAILPSIYDLSPGPTWTNITGFYRKAKAHPVSLLTSSHPHSPGDYFREVHLPNLNTSSWNDTLAEQWRGDFDWASVDSWSMNLKERRPESNASGVEDWTWVKGSATLQSARESIDYDFYGLHHVPNGTYRLYGMPDGVYADIRHIPTLYPDHQNFTAGIILAELKKEVDSRKNQLLLVDVRPDDLVSTKCPLLMYFTLPHLPHGVTQEEVALYDNELYASTGIRSSLRKPPRYWAGVGLGGVVVADQCGWAMGIEGGKGVRMDEFWSRSVSYAAFATVCQLVILILLIRQMEMTRTPSTLAKVSLWTMVIMFTADSWIFSAYVVIGIFADDKTSLPLLVPGFLCLCTAVIFGPRYAVLLYRTQAPERVSTPRAATAPSENGTGNESAAPLLGGAPHQESVPWLTRVVEAFETHPNLKWFALLGIVLFSFSIGAVPGVLPAVIFVLFSAWVPQIWRSARRGTSSGLSPSFVIGTSVARLGLPLYAFACPDNIFFVSRANWVWAMVAWQWMQVMMLFAQERYGPAFFLPKRFQPAESFNYHPPLPSIDPENPKSSFLAAETTCSICMEEVDIRPTSTASSAGEAILGLGNRKGYALAPCHHLFHTRCLAQWLAIKTICPLCKRSLPPL